MADTGTPIVEARGAAIPPRLVVFSGPPGVGKSSLSYRLARETGWAVLARDQIDRTLDTLGRDLVSYPPLTAYHVIFGLAELNLRNGVSLILDAVFPAPDFRERVIAIAREEGARFYAVVCYSSDRALWRRRMEGRPEMVRGWTPATWADAERVESAYVPWPTPHLPLDAAQPFDANVDALLRYVSSPWIGLDTNKGGRTQ